MQLAFQLYLHPLQIIRHEDTSAESLCSLGRVERLAMGQIGVFGMVEQEVFHTKLSGQATGIECRAVMLLIGLECVTVTIEAEGFGQQPVCSLDISAASLVVRLVAQADQRAAVGQSGPKTELLLFGGTDVEA